MIQISSRRLARTGQALAALAFALALAACVPDQPRPGYENPATGLRFSPAKGWDVADVAEEGCTFAVECVKGPDLRFLICVGPPRPEILFTQNTFVSCENLKQYIAEKLKGIQPACSAGKAGPLFGYDTLYARYLQSGSRVRVQFVSHLFAPAPGKLVQVIAYSIGDDDKAAQELFEANRYTIIKMIDSIRLR
jgi:hypothetical protein